MATFRVLVVSDNNTTASVSHALLESLDLQVDVMHSDELTDSFINTARYQLLIIDTGNSQKNIRLCHELQPAIHGAKILLAAGSDQAHHLLAYAAGADECIAQPIGAGLLRAKIRAWQRRVEMDSSHSL